LFRRCAFTEAGAIISYWYLATSGDVCDLIAIGYEWHGADVRSQRGNVSFEPYSENGRLAIGLS